jgi:hypothetical protein
MQEVGRIQYSGQAALFVYHSDCCLRYISNDTPCIMRMIELTFSVGFEILNAMAMKSIIFWYLVPRSPIEVHRCFGDTATISRVNPSK